MKGTSIVVALGVGFLAVCPTVGATTYAIDQEHTTASFKVRHVFTQVQGWFKEVKGSFVYEPEKPEQWMAQATIQATSIDTRVPERDNHLRSKDFFDVARFPTITFTSTEVVALTPETAKLSGLLTIHGIEKPVTLDLEIHGVGKDPWGNVRAGFTATTTINRKDFGLIWNEALETGQVLVGEEVGIVLEVEGIAQQG